MSFATLTHNKCTSCFSPHASRVRRSCQCQILLQTQLSQKQIFAISLSAKNNKNDLCYEISPSWPAIPSTKWIIYINLSNCRYLSSRATLSQNCRLLEICSNIIKFQSFKHIFLTINIEMISPRCFQMSLVEHRLIFLYSHSRELLQVVNYYSELENFTNAIVSIRCHRSSSSSCCIIIDMYKVSFLHVVIHNLIICWENVRVIKKLLDNTSFRTSKKVWRRIHTPLPPLFLSICVGI